MEVAFPHLFSPDRTRICPPCFTLAIDLRKRKFMANDINSDVYMFGVGNMAQFDNLFTLALLHSLIFEGGFFNVGAIKWETHTKFVK